MTPFTRVESAAAPLMLRNVDTDVIIPMRRLVQPGAELGRYAFEALRYRGEQGEEDPGFVLNRPEYRGAEILRADENFGCGSSREPAVVALQQLGFRCVIAPSFGDIFHSHCFQRGVLPVVLPREQVLALAARAAVPGARFAVDLERRCVADPEGNELRFEVSALRRESLLLGLDDIELTLRRRGEIEAFQARDRRSRPWVYRTSP